MSEPPPPIEAARDFQQELAFLRGRIRALARGRFLDAHDDVASDAWIRLDRALRREGARNKEALMTSIAWRAWVDFMSKERTASRFQGHSEAAEFPDAPAETESELDIDPEALEIWAFAAMSWFAREQPKCVDPLRAKLTGLTWVEIATALGEPPNSIAKRWQRCKEAYLEHVRSDHGDLGRILEYLEQIST